MKPADDAHRRRVAELVAAAPTPKITDPTTLARIARLLTERRAA
jgi:hypothetical protein